MDKTLVLFDFDGTITTKDSFLELIKFSKGKTAFAAGMLLQLPFIFLFKARIISAKKLKEKVLSYFWRNTSETDFNKLCFDFYKQKLPEIIRPKAIEAIKEHLNNNYDVTVVTASAEDWIKIFCDAWSIKCIGTRLEKKAGKITGNISGENCKGAEKLLRVKQVYNLEAYKQIIVYGDSSGDKELFDIATKVFYKPFRDE